MSINPADNFVPPLSHEIQHLVGGIKRVLALPCSNPVEVYVETLVPAVIGAFYTIIEPDPKEIYHKVTGKSFICDVTTSAEKAYAMTGREANATTRFLFKSAAVYDIATWWFFLADIAAEGLVNWTSMIYNQRECNDKGNPNYGSGPGFSGALNGGLANANNTCAYSAPSKFAPVSPNSITIPKLGSGFIAVNWQYKLSGQAVATESWIQTSVTNVRLDYDNNANDDGSTSSRPTRTWAKYQNGHDEVETVTSWNFWGGPPDLEVFRDPDVAHCTKFSSA